MAKELLPLRDKVSLSKRRTEALQADVLEKASSIVSEVRAKGEPALRDYAAKFGDLVEGAELFLQRDELEKSLGQIGRAEISLLERVISRIRSFADEQLKALGDLSVPIPGGRIGHQVSPVRAAGCYAPGGRFPLPSSLLMTVVTARAAGVPVVWAASPKPAPVTLAAAYLSGAEGLLASGGAQAIAALAYGAGPLPACDVIAGPGSSWVTAAKHLVSADVRIDMLAGPTELVIVADAKADAELIAADLLAQSEHDVEAFPVLFVFEKETLQLVRAELEKQLATLPTAETCRVALENGASVLVSGIAEAAALSDAISPEHLELHFEGAKEAKQQFRNYGAVFVGGCSAEVLCDYGAGPNHVLPTGGTSRGRGGLSVFDFIRIQTWLEIDKPSAAAGLLADARDLARLEGLEAHARAAERRI